jgi:DNA-binding protein H-NS
VNILAAWREKNPLVNEALSACSPSIVAESTKRKPSFFCIANLSSLSVDELWRLREEVGVLLAAKISDELEALGKRLEQLRAKDHSNARIYRKAAKPVSRTRRPYPTVMPKYQNSSESSETWSGRGKQPRWLSAQLGLGKQLDDFRIATGGSQRNEAGQ